MKALLQVRRRPLAAAFATALAIAALSACSSGDYKPPTAAALLPEDTRIITSDNSAGATESRAPGGKSIPIVVNGEPITSYDINQRLRLMRLGGGSASNKAAADELVDEMLQSLEAQRRGVSAGDGQVNAAYASIASNLKLSTQQLNAALQGEGISPDTLKKRLRAQLIWQQLVQQRTQTKGSVRADDITAALREKGDPSSITTTEYVLQQIIFVVPKGSAGGLYAQRRSEAQAFRQRFKGCDQALEQAKALRGVVVKDIGRRDTSQLGGPQGEQIQATPAGKTAPPEQTEEGIELIAVCSTRDIQSTAVARAEVENELYLKQASDLGKDYLAELRSRAIIEYR